MLTQSLADIDQWRAKIHLANDSGKKGDFDQVGYIMISLADNTIVPVARGDEHRNGFELLIHLARKTKSLHPADYYPFWPHGDNFLYNREQITNLLAATKKFVAYGGSRKLKIRGSNDLRTRTTTIAAFLENDGAIDPKPGQLAPLGQNLYDAFVDLNNAIVAALASLDDPGAVKPTRHAFTCARSVLTSIRFLQHHRFDAILQYGQARINELDKNDLTGLQALFFNFQGVKYQMHQLIREMIARRDNKKIDYFIDEDLVAIWGDVDLANNMLGLSLTTK